MKRIICIGNRYLPEDAAGYEVYQYLIKEDLPADVEIVDGGLAGLNLLGLMEGIEQVVFVDAIKGFGKDRDIRVLEMGEIIELAGEKFNHAAGLPYLLRVFPDTCDGDIPEVSLVGVAGIPTFETIKKASLLAIKLVMENNRTRCVNE